LVTSGKAFRAKWASGGTGCESQIHQEAKISASLSEEWYVSTADIKTPRQEKTLDIQRVLAGCVTREPPT
jgi:hypothetical protein